MTVKYYGMSIRTEKKEVVKCISCKQPTNKKWETKPEKEMDTKRKETRKG